MAVNPIQLYIPQAGVNDQIDDIEEFERRRQENRRRLAEAMRGRQIEHPLQGIAQLTDTLFAGLQHQRDKSERTRAMQEAADLYSKMYGGGATPQPGSQPPPSSPPPTASEERPRPQPAPMPADIAQNFNIAPPSFRPPATVGFGDAGMVGAPVPPPPVPAPAPPPQVARAPVNDFIPGQVGDPNFRMQPQVASAPPPPMPATRRPPEPMPPVGMPGGPMSAINPDIERRYAGPLPSTQSQFSSAQPVTQEPQSIRAPIPMEAPRTGAMASSSPVMTAPGEMDRLPIPMPIDRGRQFSSSPLETMPGGSVEEPLPPPMDLRSRALTAVMPRPEPMPEPPAPTPAMRPLDASVAASRPAGLMGLGAATMAGDQGVTTTVPPVAPPPGDLQALTPQDFIDFSQRHGAYGRLPRENIRYAIAHDTSRVNGRLSDARNVPPNYQYMYDADGIYRLRPPGSAAPHTIGRNMDSIGFARRAGEGEPMSEAEIANGARLVQYLQNEYGLTPEQIRRHPAMQGGKNPREAEWLDTVMQRAQGGGAPANVAAAPQAEPPAPPAQPQGMIRMAQSSQGMTPELFRQMMLNPYTRPMAEKILMQEVQRRQGPTEDQQLDRDLKRAQIEKMQREGAAGNVGAGLNVTYGRDAEGNWVALQPTKDGRFIQTQTPEGVRIDPAAVAGAQARAREVGQGAGQAQADLPRVEALTDRITQQVDAVLNDPNLGNVTGMQALFPTLLPANVDIEERAKQLSGAAFLQAFESLKGGGQITEVEGAKATQALARLQNFRQSDEGYRQALQDFRREVLALRDLARRRAGGTGASPAPAPTPSESTLPPGFSIRRVD